jgi:uncharacterized protein (TIGR02996 family)
MHDVDGFLAVIRQTPADDLARLVFADWLDERDDPTSKLKAEFIRLELRTAAAPEDTPGRELRKLAAQLDPSWLAVMSHPKLEACRFALQFECPKQWAGFNSTGDPKVRFCDTCKRNVHYCDTLQEAQHHAANGDCVALAVVLPRRSVLARPPKPPPPKEISSGLSQLVKAVRSLDPLEQLPQPLYLAMEAINHLAPIDRFETASPPVPAVWKRKRRASRCRNRNIQRENWEDAE